MGMNLSICGTRRGAPRLILPTAALLLSAVAAAGDPTDPDEPNDTAADAGWIGYAGDGRTGFIAAADDADWFRFYARGSSSRVAVSPIDSQVDLRLTLYADDGVTLVGTSDAGGPGEAELITAVLSIGTYYRILVEGTPAAPADAGEYVAGCGAHPPGDLLSATMTGIVTAEASGEPIGHAAILLTSFSNVMRRCNQSGVYVIDALPGGTYTLQASAPGYGDRSVVATLPVRQLTQVNVTLRGTDVNGDGVRNAVDIQRTILQALGIDPATTADLDYDGSVDATDIQRVINAVLGIGT